VDEKTEEKKTSGNRLVKIVAVCLALLILIAGAMVVWFKFISGPGDGSQTEQAQLQDQSTSENGMSFGQTFPLEVFVVNLSDPGGKRYLKTKMELEFVDPVTRQELTGRLPQLRDCILMILSSKQLEDIQHVDGKIILRNELLMKINQLLKQGEIRNLFFTEFIVQ